VTNGEVIEGVHRLMSAGFIRLGSGVNGVAYLAAYFSRSNRIGLYEEAFIPDISAPAKCIKGEAMLSSSSYSAEEPLIWDPSCTAVGSAVAVKIDVSASLFVSEAHAIALVACESLSSASRLYVVGVMADFDSAKETAKQSHITALTFLKTYLFGFL
jgi:hypothetical protein